MPARNLLLVLMVTLAANHTLRAQSEPQPGVELAVLNETTWDLFAPDGKETDAIYGDIVLKNRYLTAVIAAPLSTRNANMTIHNVGGCLIDFTTRDHQSDQLGCYFPGGADQAYRAWSIVQDQGDPMVVTPDMHLKGDSIEVVVHAEGKSDRLVVDVVYRLGRDDKYLTVISRYRNDDERPRRIKLRDEMRADARQEDLVKAPNGESDRFWVEDRYWRQAYGIHSPEHSLICNSDNRLTTLDFKVHGDQTTQTLQPKDTFELERHIACGPTLMHVTDAFRDKNSPPARIVTVQFRDGLNRGMDFCRAEVTQDGNLIGVGRASRDGQLTVPLNPGNYTLRIIQNGIVVEDSTLLHVGEPDVQTHEVVVNGYRPGTLSVEITDAHGSSLPCKLQFNGRDQVPTPDFGPPTGSFGVRNLRYTPDGKFVENLHAGQYDVIVSHGPEYDAAFQTIDIQPGKNTDFNVQLTRPVDTSGWISSDFHSHSSPSGDNTSSQLGRVLNLVCEQIEFAPCTEHNRITTYQPHFDRLGINEHISSTTGIELTGSPLPLNHQNAFPLHHHPHEQDGGGPQTDRDVETQIQRLSAWDAGSDKLLQQNHPDIGWFFYDKNGDGEQDHGHADAVTLIDVMEIHPLTGVPRIGRPGDVTAEEAHRNRVFKWMQLLNQGYRIPGVVNTDAHYNFHGSGGRRNWIQCSTDAPSKIDPMEIVHAAEAGRVVMSNGPFLQVWCRTGNDSEPIAVGQDVAATNGEVQLEISVQCPNWHDIDTVAIWTNGRVQPEHLFHRTITPNLFSKQTERFHHTLTIKMQADTHLIVGAWGAGSKLGPVMGPGTGDEPPVALTNPFFVDVDGNGFTPNHDTLGQPLPTKEE